MNEREIREFFTVADDYIPKVNADRFSILAEEYKEQGIAFNVLALGAVQTEMLEEAFPGYQAPLSAAEMAQYIFDFTLTGNKYYTGKVLQVTTSNP